MKYEVSRNGKTRMKSLGTKWEKNNKVIPCSEKVEPGYFFGRGGGRIRAEKRFRVGLDFDITMMIKPRNLTGILAAVRGRRDYLVLAMNEGAIEFTVDNGRGPIQATFQPGDKHEFCNGQWHEIHAVKAKNVVTLSVNKIFAQPGIVFILRPKLIFNPPRHWSSWREFNGHKQPTLPWWTSKV